MIIDSHFHLPPSPYSWRPIPELVGGLVVASQPSDWSVLCRFCSNLDQNWKMSIGVHPWFSRLVVDWQVFESLLMSDLNISIGEVGLDGFSRSPEFSLQLDVFRRQLTLASEHHRLLSLHFVSDHEVGFNILRSYKNLRGGIVHGFSGSLVQAHAWQSLGFHLGIGPRLLINLTDKKLNMLRHIDHSMIHLESDSPFSSAQCELTNPNDLVPFLSILASHLSISAEQLSAQLVSNWDNLWSL